MLLWIVIYSYFEPPDFVKEVVVLFGEVTFWTTVVISVLVALGKWSINPFGMLGNKRIG